MELDRICQNRIIEKIEKINFSSKNILKEMYLDYKAEIGKSENEILKVSDFDTNIELFQELSLKLGSFYNAQLQFENSEIKQNKIFLLNSEETEFLAYLEKKLTIVEPFTYLIVKYLINNDFINSEIIVDEYKNYFNIKDNFQKEYVINRIFTELVEDEILEKNSKNIFKISKKYNKIFENKKENNNEINLKLIDLDNSKNTNYNFKPQKGSFGYL